MARRVEVMRGDIPPLTEQVHHYVSVCNDEVRLRKSEARAPKHVSPTGADIIPLKYEGGYKLWESSIDLAEYVHRHADSFAGTSVLELGAGHAIPAIMAARAGARRLVLQDYNEDVIREVTAVNVAANVEGDVETGYLCGGWGSVADVLLGERFDVVLSAETVYAEAQVRALARCILQVLGEGGMALVAGKSYYFGVGGGMRRFAEAVGEVAGECGTRVDVEEVHEVRDGASNVREIVKVRKQVGGA